MRQARVENAERAGVLADLRAAQIGRLELLAEALKPLVGQVPADVDLFDIAVMPGSTPRLFVDMLGFVEMGRDARIYSFIQDRRHGRFVLAESESIDVIVGAVTQYVARRLLEREKALAADLGGPLKPLPAHTQSGLSHNAEYRLGGIGEQLQTSDTDRHQVPRTEAGSSDEHRPPVLPLGRSMGRRRGSAGVFQALGTLSTLVIEVLGGLTFLALVAFVAWLLWVRAHGSV